MQAPAAGRRAIDPAATRRRVARLLGTASVEPAAMPPAAVLVVRHLADPLPHALADEHAALASHAWQRAAQAALGALFASAARPARDEHVPHGAAAVVFADRVELLACLARDLHSGFAHARWWWVAVLRMLPSDPKEAMAAACSREPALVPAALERLAEWGLATEVVSVLSPHHATQLLAAIARVFALPELPVSVRSAHASIARDGLVARADADTATSDRAGPSSMGVLPPWDPVVAAEEAPPTLGAERRALVGLALLLRRAPSVARSARFVRAWHAWRLATDDAPSPRRSTPAREPPPADVSDAAPAVAPPTSDARHGPWDNGAPRVPARTHEAGDAPLTATGAGGRTSPRVASDTVDAADVAPRHTSVPRRGGTGTSHTQDAGVEMSPMPTWRVVAPMACDTELGGVFFLVPVLGALGIPGEIEANFGIAPELSVWAWLELLARALIRNRDDVLATDPIWSILAWLDRREPGVEFVSAFSEAERYRLPPAFPTPPSGGETLDWELSGDRLRLWHRERFVVVERRVTHPIALRLALDEEGAEAAARGLGIQPLPRGARRTLRRARQCRLLGFQPKPELRRFLEFLLPYVRWRLGASLRLRDSRALTAVMLARRARVECTAAHVDVIMSLERATLPVRLAGLDADPGWVPALGRVVSFHYV